MDDSSQQGEHKGPKYIAPKDKRCPYCSQAFTSSSLGRHLDLYIRDKNPKPPDGLHDVDEIRKTRGNITRRQPRASLGGGRDVSTPSSTPRGGSRKPSVAQESRKSSTGTLPREGNYAVDSAVSQNPFPVPRWESTGVINDIEESNPELVKRPGLSRTVSRQAAQKAQLDSKKKLVDAMDTARAAELALRELLSSWRAAKQQFDANAMPFDFDPLSLDFPALTLQCLEPPPTLFSSTQHPSPTSWSIQPPGRRQFSALQTYFEVQFRTWKVACVTATTDATDDLPCPDGSHRDKREIVKRAEKSAEVLEQQVNEHLHSAFSVWERLPSPRQNELWVLELARGVGRKHKENEAFKESQHRLEQEIVNLKSQIEQLNRLQQPREFKILTPTTFPLEKNFISHAYELGLKNGTLTGFSLQDREADLATVVKRAIEKWKNVIVSSRLTHAGLGAQKLLDQPKGGSSVNGASTPQSRSQSQTPQQQTQSHPSSKRPSRDSSGALNDQSASSTTTTAPPSVDETSDQDADADMEDDDSFAIVNHSPTKLVAPPTIQQQSRLEIPRTRTQGQHQQQQQQQLQQAPPTPSQSQHQQQQQPQTQTQQQPMPDHRFMMPNPSHSPVRGATLNMSRSMPNMTMAIQTNALHAADMSMAMHGMHGEQMYLE